MRRNVYVPLQSGALAALVKFAQREMRDPRDQAALLVMDGLRRAGYDPDLEERRRPIEAAR